MATRLPQVVGGRAQVSGVPNVVLPEVQFGRRDVGTAYEAQARYQNAVGDVISRMSQAVFGVAEDMSRSSGLQFAAENPLTAEQLQAMSRGDMSKVQLGSPLNVFNATIRKARAIEVSGHAEAEMQEHMTALIEKANMGEVDADQVYGQITALTNGYSQSLAQIDPDAAYKFRATAGAIGNRVLEKVAELDGQKRMVANTVKVQRMYTNLQQQIALAATTKMPINPETGQEMPASVYIDALKQNFLVNAQSLVGVTGAAQYVNSIDNDINTSVVNSIAQYLNTDPGFANSGNGIERLLRGDAGSASNAFSLLLPEQREQVIADYRSMKALRKAEAEQGVSQAKKAQDAALDKLVFQFYDPNTPADIKVQIGRELAAADGMSRTEIQTYLNPNIPSGDPVKFAEMEGVIERGGYADKEQVKSDARLLGFNGEQTAKLIQKFNEGPRMTETERQARGFLRRVSGVPDVQSTFASNDERVQLEKNVVLQRTFSELVMDFQIKNPGGLVPFQRLAEEAASTYDKTAGVGNVEKEVLGGIKTRLDNAANKAEREGKTDLASRLRNIAVTPNINPAELREAGLIDGPTQSGIETELLKLRSR